MQAQVLKGQLLKMIQTGLDIAEAAHVQMAEGHSPDFTEVSIAYVFENHTLGPGESIEKARWRWDT
jgi:hypothetical protein